MKKIICIGMLLGSFAAAHSQSISNQVVSTSGSSGSGGGLFVDFTVGEIVVQSLSSSNYIVTQGFHQTYIENVSVDNQPGLQVKIELYPNPTADEVTVQLSGEELPDMLASLYDATGRMLMSRLLFEGNQQSATLKVDVRSLAAGTYYIQLQNDKQQPVKTLKVQKITQ